MKYYLRKIRNKLVSILDKKYRPNEINLIVKSFQNSSPEKLMIDVGAHHGGSLAPFVELGWQIYAFEPDVNNRAFLVDRFGSYKKLFIDSRAVSDKQFYDVPFYTSRDSSGISALAPFLESHKVSDRISTTTLASFIQEKHIPFIDFLKIDIEGYDLYALRGFPWEKFLPTVIMCEFEDSKTKPLGYLFHDMAQFLTGKGYQVMVSEWCPIVAYGQQHDWHSFHEYPSELINPRAWGNLIATTSPDIFQYFIGLKIHNNM